MPHTFSISTNYKDKPLPSGKELAANLATVMAQIPFLTLSLYRSVLEVGDLPSGVSSEKTMTLDSNVVLWDDLLFDAGCGLFVYVHLYVCVLRVYVTLCVCIVSLFIQ